MKKLVDWRIFIKLLGLSLISIVCVLPYVMTIQGDLLKSVPIPLPLLFAVQLIQSLILFSAAIFFGLLLSKKLEFKIHAKDFGFNVPYLKLPVITGILIALAIYLTDYLFTLSGVALSTHQNYAPAWQTLMAAVYGGISEEIIMRLFLMSLFVWIGMKLTKNSKPGKVIVWISIILASIVFGLGHLPVTASLTLITPMIILRAIVLNGIGGVVFGWFFWKKDLASAMVSHFVTDIFLLTLLPLFIK